MSSKYYEQNGKFEICPPFPEDYSPKFIKNLVQYSARVHNKKHSRTKIPVK